MYKTGSFTLALIITLALLPASCSNFEQHDDEGCLPGKVYTFGAKGGQVTIEQQNFEVKPGVLQQDVQFTFKECPEADFKVPVNHHFIGTETKKVYVVEALHPINKDYPVIKIEVPKNVRLPKNTMTACQTALDGDNAKHLISTDKNDALTPDFNIQPTNTTKCYQANFDSSLAALGVTQDSWFATLQAGFNSATVSTGETLYSYLAAIENQVNEKLEKHFTACALCQKTMNSVINKFTCASLIDYASKAGCMAALTALSGGTAVPFTGIICSSIKFVLDEAQKKLTGSSTSSHCNQTIGIEDYVNETKKSTCPLCQSYMPQGTSPCKNQVDSTTCPALTCKDLPSQKLCAEDPAMSCTWDSGECKKT